VLFALSISVCAQTPPAPTSGLKDAAKEPLQKGLAAAQQQDWKLAIRYFLEAQKADPDAPQIWFNLGLASSKLPGYELRALAWFRAYLLAVPDASNADPIRQQIATLEVAFESRMNKIIEALEIVPPVLDAAGQKMKVYGPFSLYVTSSAKLLAAARAFLGNTTGVLNTLRLAKNGTGYPWRCDSWIPFMRHSRFQREPTLDAFLAATGHLPAAELIAAPTPPCSQNVGYFLEASDFAGAQAYIGAESDYFTERALRKIACAAFDRDDQKALEDALAKAGALFTHRDDPDRVSKSDLSIYDREDLGLLLVAVGERTRARAVAMDLFQVFFKGTATTYDQVAGLLVAVGENSRADQLDRSAADAFRSGREVLYDPCIETEKYFEWQERENWWGRNRKAYLINVAIRGVTFHKCSEPLNCSDAGDETQLVELLQQGKDILGGSDVVASLCLLRGIADDLAHLAEEYRRVHGPYGHLPKTCADPTLNCKF
jgi:hypothetical protein